MNVKNVIALFELFQKGKSVASPEKWKKRQVTVTLVVPIISAIVEVARSFGIDVNISGEANAAIATALIALVNVVLTFTTTDKIGVQAKGRNSANAGTEVESEEFRNFDRADKES